MIGDVDPEDAYDEGDPPHVKLKVLEAVVADLLAAPADERREIRRVDALRLVGLLEQLLDELHFRLTAVRQALEDLGGN